MVLHYTKMNCSQYGSLAFYYINLLWRKVQYLCNVCVYILCMYVMQYNIYSYQTVFLIKVVVTKLFVNKCRNRLGIYWTHNKSRWTNVPWIMYYCTSDMMNCPFLNICDEILYSCPQLQVNFLSASSVCVKICTCINLVYSFFSRHTTSWAA